MPRVCRQMHVRPPPTHASTRVHTRALHCLLQAAVTQQRRVVHVPTAECAEHFQRWLAAALGQYRVAEALAHAANGILVVQARLLECGECVRGHALRPLVRVVAGRISTRKDVAEGAQEAVLGQRGQHREPILQLPLLLQRPRAQLLRGHTRRRPLVQRHVDRPEVELPQRGQPGLEGAHSRKLVERVVVQRSARGGVARQAAGHGAVVEPVLHELAGKLHGVPLHATNTGCVRKVNRGQHVLQPVPELVQHSLHLPRQHQRRGARGRVRRALVAGQEGHGSTELAARLQRAGPHLRHPGASLLLARPREGVEVKPRKFPTVAAVAHGKELHVRVPRVHAILDALDRHAQYPLRQLEHTLQHPVQREVQPQRLL
mmetsp:Transcript_3360/g.10546  ORF Transcript_3360/g.10546 Transcript_3360/m.10546 type:complete len:374 (-) Transcript_3360:1082-2203(-)